MNMQQLGYKIRDLRIKKGFSQAQLAEDVCSVSYLSIIERGVFTGEISVEKLSALSTKLGVKLQDLMNEIVTADLENEILLDMVKVSILRAEFDYALDLIDKLQQRDNLLQYQQDQVTLSLSECLIKKGEASKAIEVLNDFNTFLEVRQSTDHHIIAKVSNLLGNANYAMNEMITAHSHYLRAFQVCSSFTVDDLLSANINYNLGIVCRSLRMDKHAKSHLEKAKSLYESLGDRRRLADALYYLGITMKNLSQLQIASDYIKHSLALYEFENITWLAQLVKSQYAFYFLALDNHEQAIAEMRVALDEYERLGDRLLWVYTSARIAHIHLDVMEIENAEEVLLSAMEFLDENKLDPYYAYFYRVYARFLTEVKKYDESLEFSFKSAELFDKMGLRKEQATSLRQAVTTYQQQGKMDEVVSLYEKVVQTLEHALDFLVLT